MQPDPILGLMFHYALILAGALFAIGLISVVVDLVIEHLYSKSCKKDMLRYAWSKGCLEDPLARALLGVPYDESRRRLQLLELQGEEECIRLYKNRLTNDSDILQAKARIHAG